MLTGTALLEGLRKRKSPHGTVMAVSMMKDEVPFLLEWFAHHLAVGFTDILVYTNDCTDGTVEMLERLEELGLGYHRPNVIPKGVKPQPSAIQHAQREPLVAASDWVILFDADEFLCINHPSGHLDGLLNDTVARGANGVVITWRIFGSSGVVDWSNAPVTEQYLRAAPPLWNKGWGVKTLFQFDPEYWKLGIHRPSIKNKHLEGDFPETIHWLNGSGLPMEEYFRFRGWRSIRRTLGYNWAQMNHYAVKSIDSYAVRKFRGNVNYKKDKYNDDYWSLQDRNEVEDRNILRHRELRSVIMDALLQDPILKRLHHTAVDQVEARLEAFKKTDDYAVLKSSLIEASKVPISQISAKPPKARDPAKIAALMSRVERQNADKPVTERRTTPSLGWSPGDPLYLETIDLSQDMQIDWVPNHAVELPADPRLFSPIGLNAVLSGRFDRRNARNIEGYLENANRVLDIGAGLGFIAMKALKNMPELVVMAHDLRSALIDVGKQVAARNGFENSPHLRFVDGPLAFSNAPDDAQGFAAYIRDFQPDVLRLSEPEQLTPTQLETIDLAQVRRVILPASDAALVQALVDMYAPVLHAKGLELTQGRDASGSAQFDRPL